MYVKRVQQYRVEVQEYYSEQNQNCDVGGRKQEAFVCKKWMLEPSIRNTGKIKTFLLVQWMHYNSMLFKKNPLHLISGDTYLLIKRHTNSYNSSQYKKLNKIGHIRKVFLSNVALLPETLSKKKNLNSCIRVFSESIEFG